jgi:hypothetical protein
MRAWNFTAPKMALDVRVDYYVTLLRPDGSEWIGPRTVRPGELAEMRETMSVGGMLEKGYRMLVERSVTVWEVEACYDCQARPCAIDYDCDGPYRRSVCEDDQCNRGSNPDNAGWVAGRTPLWGPGHPEWDNDCETSYCVLTAGHDTEDTGEHVDATGYVFTR